MAYQSINPYTEELIKSFNQHTDEQLESDHCDCRRHL